MKLAKYIPIAIVSLTIGTIAYAQVITVGAPLEDHDCIFIPDCPGINTPCVGPPGVFMECYWCTDPKKQKMCSPGTPRTCQNTLWGPINGCGDRYNGSCSNGQPCQGPFVADGFCPKKMCFILP